MSVSPSPRRFLLITSPYGAFGRLLNGALRARGAEVEHMIFHMGDVLDRRGPGGRRFDGRPEDWPAAYAEMAPRFTDVVVYGEGRWPNWPALEARDPFGPRVWVLENGYFRPDWVTLERNGAAVNGTLPRQVEAYAAPVEDPPPARPVGPITRPLVVAVGRYWLAEFLTRPFAFRRHRHGFDPPPWRQAAGHVLRWLRGPWATRGSAAASAARGPYFLICLQREGDVQLTRNSHLNTNADFVAAVFDDFVRHAPADARLVVKNHPLDPGVVDQRRQVLRAAARRGLSDRVDFVDGGTMGELCRPALGLVVNTSSAALAALGFGLPVKTLGRAFFDLPGLTHQGTLAEFWTRPQAPDPELFRRFRAHVMVRTQINGSFEGPRVRADTARAVADAMMRGRPVAEDYPL